MKSKVTIAGHPVHSMLVPFPVVLYTITFASLVTYKVSSVYFWFQAGFTANLIGISFAVLAAALGFMDWALAIPSSNPAKETGRMHMIFNVTALVLFSVSAWLESQVWSDVLPNVNAEIYLSGFGLFCTYTAALYGWNLVQKHHIGVDMTMEQENLEPAQPQKYFASNIRTQNR